MKRPMKLTDADQQLLSVLRENARASTAQIARRLNLSRTTVQSRIERLEREGVISGYTVRVHDEYDRSHLRAHIMIAVHPKQMTSVVAALRAMPELRVLHSVSGSHDLIAIGAVPSRNANAKAEPAQSRFIVMSQKSLLQISRAKPPSDAAPGNQPIAPPPDPPLRQPRSPQTDHASPPPAPARASATDPARQTGR